MCNSNKLSVLFHFSVLPFCGYVYRTILVGRLDFMYGVDGRGLAERRRRTKLMNMHIYIRTKWKTLLTHVKKRIHRGTDEKKRPV